METETRQTKTAVIAGLRAELNRTTIPVLEAVDGDTRDAPWGGDPGVRMSRQQRRAAARSQQPAQRGNVGLNAGARGWHRVVVPHSVDQRVDRHRAVAGDQQHGQHRALLGCPQRHPHTIRAHQQRPQDAEPETAHAPILNASQRGKQPSASTTTADPAAERCGRRPPIKSSPAFTVVRGCYGGFMRWQVSGCWLRSRWWEERLIVQQRIHASQLLGQPPQHIRKNRLPQRALIAYFTKHDGLNPFHNKGIEAIFPGQPNPNPGQRAELFRSK